MQDCRQFDTRFPHSPGTSDVSTGENDSETPDFSLLLDPDRPMTPDYSEEDIVRMMLTATFPSSASNGGGLFPDMGNIFQTPLVDLPRRRN
ncbi:unnamed protein product [Hymenolepis diminuta]|uniref:Uncharacterized protein n=1 Tax=Hymenolepis diminuta TaxID=6216 RepID=A0A3P7BB63_HYMDI|nr:unnamed protein product [Hymenolepis diminuta]